MSDVSCFGSPLLPNSGVVLLAAASVGLSSATHFWFFFLQSRLVAAVVCQGLSFLGGLVVLPSYRRVLIVLVGPISSLEFRRRFLTAKAMGTTVFHPQDCLTAPQRGRSRQFPPASECPSSVAGPCRRAFSATPEALATFTPGIMRPGEYREQILDQGHLLGRRKAAVGLLPAPGRGTQSGDASTFHKCPSVPAMESSASASFPWNGAQVSQGRLSARMSVTSLKGECRTGSWCSTTATASQKLNFSGKLLRFSDEFRDGCPRCTGIGEPKVEYRKRLRPEMARGETHIGRTFSRPPCKVCTTTTIPGRKHGVGKQLKRAASDRASLSLQRSATKEAMEKLVANSSGRISLNCNGNDTFNSASSASTTEKGNLRELWDAGAIGKTGAAELGAAKSSLETVVALSGTKCCGRANVAILCEGKIKGDKSIGVAGYVSQGDHARHGQVQAIKLRRQEPMAGSRMISRSLNSVVDNDGMWVALMHDEKWAGPSFFNSPPPSSLPVPSFTVKFSRSASTGSKAGRDAAYITDTTSDSSARGETRLQDVIVATNDLRRMLNLDYASGDT